MKVFLFKDYLESIQGIGRMKKIAEIEPLETIPNSLVKIDDKHARICCINITDSPACYIEWVKEPIGGDEYIFEPEAKCPHCGYTLSDSWELLDDDEETCGACGSVYSITRNIEVSYSSILIERNDRVISLKTN